ncbi:MAG: hypothetical protein JSW34_09900 [Candidatus Zixiibacteriota bacterium]|nr:MAG: hypothetical protein JSW34_09900 [candidate division Zixibacteria bacterium]
MKRTLLTAILFLMIFGAALLIGPGCSHESPVDPVATGAATVETSKPVTPTTFVETFDSHRNVGGWSFGTTHRPVIEDLGGNTGGYLHDPSVITFAPSPGTELGEESIFTGNYRERKVTSVGIDLRCIDYEWDITTRYLTLIIMNDNGTPLDLEDDWGAYFIGDITLPSKYVAWLTSTMENEPGWVSYDFNIPSQENPLQEDRLPEGWNFIRWWSGSGQQPGGSWVALMQNVSYIQFCYGDPTLYYVLQTFDLGLDNPRISWQ